MKWKEIVTDYITFTRRERIGIIFVLTLIIIVILLPTIFTGRETTKMDTSDTTWMTAAKKIEQKETSSDENMTYGNETSAYQYDQSRRNDYNKSTEELFYFDPNTLSKEGWQKLGLRDKTIQTIQNYLGKGGRFKKAEDLQRVYGLHKDEYERLLPYIKFEGVSAEGHSTGFAENKNPVENKAYFKNTLRYNSININTADTSAFINLPGIGSKLATRIVNFRDKLGGFYSVEQVSETFGLPDSTFQKIKEYLTLKNNSIKKINVNTATTDELKSHPYIKWNIANSIIAYRKEHGVFSNIEDIKKIMIITDDIYKKIAPYLDTQ